MALENNYCVYKHTNKINGKIYIGLTKYGNKPNQRWREGKGYKYHGHKFYNAIQTYGWDNFEHQILKNNLTLEEANYWEDYYIVQYDTINSGYNARRGGVHGQLTEEAKEKLSKICKEKGLWKGDKNPRHQYPLFGEENPMYGKHHTKETKAKISQANKGRTMSQEAKDKISEFMSLNHPRTRKVQCIETEEVFASAAEAGRKYNVNRGSITRVCTGDRNTCKGLHWKYYTDINMEEH